MSDLELLLELAEIKTRFPLWSSYCDNDEDKLTADAQEAVRILLGYIPDVTAANITTALESDYMTIVRKICFDRRHAGREFEHRPQILKDFERAVERLDDIRQGKLQGLDSDTDEDADPEDGEHITMHARTRKFGTWFTDDNQGSADPNY